MYNLQDLEQHLTVTKILLRREGLFVYTRYHNWHNEYDFLIQPDGRVKGETIRNLWLEVSQELAVFVREKAKFILKEQPSLVCV